MGGSGGGIYNGYSTLTVTNSTLSGNTARDGGGVFGELTIENSTVSGNSARATGGGLAVLTWSFFVLCTPVADAGFLLDFPVRLITNIRMLYTEIVVWVIAILINVVFFFASPELYETTFLTALLMEIMTHPWPYGGIIVLCGIGTFMSIMFGDELMDVASHSERVKHHKHGFLYRALMTGTLFILIFVAYGFLLQTLGVDLPSDLH